VNRKAEEKLRAMRRCALKRKEVGVMGSRQVVGCGVCVCVGVGCVGCGNKWGCLPTGCVWQANTQSISVVQARTSAVRG